MLRVTCFQDCKSPTCPPIKRGCGGIGLPSDARHGLASFPGLTGDATRKGFTGGSTIAHLQRDSRPL